MAIYHLSGQVIKRSEGRSSVACASYRCGYDLTDDRLGETYSFSRADRVGHTEIMLPDNAPREFSDRSVLWNEVEKIEKRKDAQVAREFDVALPIELSNKEKIKIGREWAQGLVDKGMIVDICFHNLDDENPHFHAMATMREVSPGGFLKKNREWNDVEFLKELRVNWQEIANKSLEENNIESRIDHRSHEARGIEKTPEIHHGNKAFLIEKNNKIKEKNKLLEYVKEVPKKVVEVVKNVADDLSNYFKNDNKEEEKDIKKCSACGKKKQQCSCLKIK